MPGSAMDNRGLCRTSAAASSLLSCLTVAASESANATMASTLWNRPVTSPPPELQHACTSTASCWNWCCRTACSSISSLAGVTPRDPNVRSRFPNTSSTAALVLRSVVSEPHKATTAACISSLLASKAACSACCSASASSVSRNCRSNTWASSSSPVSLAVVVRSSAKQLASCSAASRCAEATAADEARRISFSSLKESDKHL
mmetsp:Transcript_37170/g.81232  ORF Transcript_37170/g.81232 Transcript_37170/m.81232 type:complete len:203 (+) Transcript_37170:295-903(+)